MKTEYDLNSAVTFFLVGLSIGSFLTRILAPKRRLAHGDLGSSRRSDLIVTERPLGRSPY